VEIEYLCLSSATFNSNSLESNKPLTEAIVERWSKNSPAPRQPEASIEYGVPSTEICTLGTSLGGSDGMVFFSRREKAVKDGGPPCTGSPERGSIAEIGAALTVCKQRIVAAAAARITLTAKRASLSLHNWGVRILGLPATQNRENDPFSVRYAINITRTGCRSPVRDADLAKLRRGATAAGLARLDGGSASTALSRRAVSRR
jgi:hypothetical protein